MASVSSSTYTGLLTNSSTRVTGLATGLDTDQMVSDLMKAERIPLDKLYQKRQLAEWKQDAYRDITNLLRGLQDEYLNVLKSSSNMLSQNSYKKYTGASTDSSVVTVSGNSAAMAGNHKVLVTQLATASVATSSTGVTKAVKSTDTITKGTPESDVVNSSGKTIKITLDGVTKEIIMGTFDNASTVDDLKMDLQAKIDTAFGTGKVTVSKTGGILTFGTTGGASKITLADGSSNSGLSYLHIDSGASNRINTSESLGALADKLGAGLTFVNGNVTFKINSKEFTFSSSTALSTVMSTISNDATANVNFTYDESTDKFKITAKQTGSGNNIVLEETGGTFFAAAGLSSPVIEAGKDAMAKVDDQLITRSTNTFTLNGVTYTLVKTSTEEQTVSLTQDVDSIYDNIKGFIDKYNEVIGKINDQLSAEYDRDYQPLTDAQKSGMSDDDIKKWEEQAKTGLLRNDSILSKIVSDMRRAFSDPVPGVSSLFSSIGIASTSYTDKGKLTIDETKLKDALRNNPDEVMNLFSKQSVSQPSYSRSATASERATRYSEEGLVQRLSDILQDNISTLRDSSGKKGTLLEKAGIAGDLSEYNNSLYHELEDYDTSITSLTEKLKEKEENYYTKFANLETYINKMNAQSSWLTSQFSQS